jgi:hypothetical protein
VRVPQQQASSCAKARGVVQLNLLALLAGELAVELAVS